MCHHMRFSSTFCEKRKQRIRVYEPCTRANMRLVRLGVERQIRTDCIHPTIAALMQAAAKIRSLREISSYVVDSNGSKKDSTLC